MKNSLNDVYPSLPRNPFCLLTKRNAPPPRPFAEKGVVEGFFLGNPNERFPRREQFYLFRRFHWNLKKKIGLDNFGKKNLQADEIFQASLLARKYTDFYIFDIF